MAVHPFAQKLEIALEHAKRLRDELLARRDTETGDSLPDDPPGTWRDSLGRLRYITHIFGFRQLGALARDTPAVKVEPGEANASLDRKSMDMQKDKRLQALNKAYAKALAACEQARQAARGPGGTRQLSDGTFAPIRRPEVSVPCPQAAAIAKQISAYISQRYGRVGPKPVANSGGGGGGGF